MTKLTIKEVAQEAGVSTATISRVLNGNGYVSEEARKRVLETVERLQYKPNTIARSLKQERSGGVGFVMPDLTNPYFMRISRKLQQSLAAEGYYVFFMDSNEQPDKERDAMNFLLEKRTEAILLAGTGGNVDLLTQVIKSGIPLILIDREVRGVDTDLVKEDNYSTAKTSVARLVRNGHLRIGLLEGPRHISTSAERIEGAIEGLRGAGISVPDAYRYQGDYSRASGAEAYAYFQSLTEPPTAIFSANNEMTFGFYLGMRGWSAPLDGLEVVSFGELESAPLFRNRLIEIRQNPEAVAEAAAELLILRLKNGRGAGKEKRIVWPSIEG